MNATPDNTLADAEQRIADLERQLAEAREQQAATAEVLQVINSSPGNLDPVFDAMLEKAMRLCGAAFGSLYVLEGEHFLSAAQRGVPSAYAAFRARHPPSLEQGFGPAALLETRKPFQVLDMQAHELYRLGHPRVRAMVELGGVRTSLIVPLLNGDALLGFISIYRQEVRAYSEKETALLESFAAQAVIAMENARLLTETREALEQQTATAEVLQVINASPGDLAPVFEAMLGKAMRLCDAAFGTLFTYDGALFHMMAYRGEPAYGDYLRRGSPFHPERAVTFQRLLRGADIVHIADVLEDEAYRGGEPVSREAVEVSGMRTLLSVALRKDGGLLGSLATYRQEVRPFTDKQIALLENFAAQAVIAMENARLITETREALEQQTATAEVLQVINSSPGDLAPVFEAILNKAHALCGATLGSLASYDGELFHRLAMHGYPPEYEALVRSPNNPASYAQRLLDGARFVHHADLAATVSDLDPLSRASVEIVGTRTILFVPLRKDGKLLGYITAGRREVRPFTEKEITLLENFAAQAVIAMENARLLTETREALEQQTATAEVLGVINTSPGDLAPVFDAMLEKATRLCEAEMGAFWTYDGEKMHVEAIRGASPQFAEFLKQGPLRPSPGQQQLLHGERIVHVVNVTEGASYRSGNPLVRAAADLGGINTILVVPLRKDGVLLGTIGIYRQEVRPFSDKQIALLQSFAEQAVIAMENARLLAELRQRTSDLEQSLEYQTATSDVLQVISRSAFDLKPVLDTVIDTAARLCQGEVGFIAIRDGDVYQPLATFAVSTSRERFAANSDTLLRTRVFKADNTTVVGHAVSERKVIHVADIQTEPAYASSPSVVLSTGLRTTLGVPLLRLGEPIGVLSLGRWRVEPFTDRQIELVRTFADQAVIAMENARLLGELRQRTDEVAELNRGLEARVAEQVEELGRVGRLKRFLAPQLAELIVSQGNEKILESHRREIVVVFCDLRGYTAFTETAEPEEVLDFLRDYHGALGPLVAQFEGTLDQFSGDGIMVFFNDPVPIPDPAERAVKMAMAMREEAGKLSAAWRRHGCELGFGVGIAQGYATLGQIGFSERSGYTAIGTVCNLAARLCAEAKDGQILVSSRIAGKVEAVVKLEDLGNLELKGLHRPVAAFNVVRSTSPAEARPSLTVVARGPRP
jgi:GAF domain-containing protein